MMTPSDLKAYEFKTAGRNAYKAEDVDSFLAQVSIDYEKMYREKIELTKRMSLLADRIEQYKKDENEIKQAVLSAQKAADIIVREAENSVEDIKKEAEDVLAAAKSEADIIKVDAERQAIADSELLLSVARDKAEKIINEAKEEAHGILIKANDSASDTVGAATRTITSESIHYEMLKKEVSDFRASVLAQYKEHIELISRLPDMAKEEADKIAEKEAEQTAKIEAVVDEIVCEDTIKEPVAFEYIEENDVEDDFEFEGEEVVKTQLPYDFFAEDSKLEYVTDEEYDEEPEEAGEKSFTVDFDAISQIDDFKEGEDEPSEENNNEERTDYPADIPITRAEPDSEQIVSADDTACEDTEEKTGSIFDSIERIESEEEEEGEEEEAHEDESQYDEPKKKGFFRFRK